MRSYSRRNKEINEKRNSKISFTNEKTDTHVSLSSVDTNNSKIEEAADGEDEMLGGRLKMMVWNAGGLNNKFDRLVGCLKRSEAHFAVVTETWWRADGAIPRECQLNAICPTEGLRKLSGTNGISLVVNPNLASSLVVKSVSSLAKDTVHGCFLAFLVAGVQVVVVYNAPSLQLSLDELLDSATSTARIDFLKPLVILGDFNARLEVWGDAISNNEGWSLDAWMSNKGLSRCCSGPAATFDNGRGRSIIDHVFCNFTDTLVLNLGKPMALVDHSALLADIPFSRIASRPADRSYTRIRLEKLYDPEIRSAYRSFTDVQLPTLKAALERLRNERTLECLDQVDKVFCKYFKSIGQEVLGTKVAGKRLLCYKPLESPVLSGLYLEQEFSPSIDNERAIVKELCRLRKVRFEEFSASLEKKPARDVLKIVSQINSNRKSRHFALQENPAAFREYAAHFKTMNTNNLPEVPIDEVILSRDSERCAMLASEIFCAGTILNVLQSVPWNKAAGASGVSYDLLKGASNNAISVIAEWFGIIFEIGLVPSSWTRSLVVPVPKKGDLNLIKNYRPISLTESFRKLFEHCVNKYMTRTFPANHFTQGGFRSHHCVMDMVTALHQALSRKRGMHVAFLDIRAAYDSVDRRILWKRCKERGLNDELIWILRRLFDHNSAQLVIGGKRSEPFPILAGVLQGSVLSPALYSIFIDDLAKTLNRNCRVTIGHCKYNSTLYADDIAVFAESKEALQFLLTICTNHAKANRYQFNVGKCAVIGATNFSYMLDGLEIPQVSQFTYLGVETNRNGIMAKEFLDRRCKSAVVAGHRLISLGMNAGGFPLKACSMLYKVFIRSKLEAGVGILPDSKTIARKLEAAQRTVLARIFFCGPTSSGTILRSLLNCPSMAFRCKFLRSRYLHRVLLLPDTHILRRLQPAKHFYIEKLVKNSFSLQEVRPSNRRKLVEIEMEMVHGATAAATDGFLVINATEGIPWFVLDHSLVPSLRKRLLQWMLKKFPASEPPACGRCVIGRCTQSHVAECNHLLENLAPDIPPRFRPEFLLSHRLAAINVVADAVNAAVGNCLPCLRLH